MNFAEVQTATPGTKLVSLHSLVNDLLSYYRRVTKDHRRFFVNEIPTKLSVPAGSKGITPEFSDLLAIISSNPGKHGIRISARNSAKGVKLLIRTTEIKGFSFSGIRVQAAW